MAFRVFYSTQYIRHHSKPMYTPEPDVCHEVIGHVPMFADKEFADFSQEIGLASLGASDEDIKKLGTVYWYTIEFGLCKENDGDLRAYGAGLLSSFGELKYCLGGDEQKPQYLEFNPTTAAAKPYPITTYQPLYYVANSFVDANAKVLDYAQHLDKDFTLRYNPYTQSVEVLNNREQIMNYVKDIQHQLGNLNSALLKIPIGQSH